MRNFFIGAIFTAILVFGVTFFIDKHNTEKAVIESSDAILSQIKNVGKLVVTEGHFAEVITYKDDKKLYLDLITATKKAIVVVNAKVLISYDLSMVTHQIDTENKIVTITKIPEPEIDINPEIKYHALEEDFLNQFDPEDHNKIRKTVISELDKRVKTSTLVANSKNRLISELQKIYILTNSLGWTLQYEEKVINTQIDIQELILHP
ncbi:DUF4230 domain-containing protein [Aquimarina pacifica]|uniref:DUF4230 domain-containing protein n=1 Tax=Aquimarina pacifica TaxID=1296415 RepID=UPI00047051E4|nr:DUF4230 domain-containing protein [Aquimarina pacifica]